MKLNNLFKNLFSKKNKNQQTITLAQATGTHAVVKCNVNSKGERIYHTESSRSYNVVKPVEVFQTEEEAQAAGYRKSRV